MPWQTWSWRHQMEKFSLLLAINAWNSLVPSEFPAQRPVTRSYDVFFDLRLNKRLSQQSWGWWFEMLLFPLWHHCNGQSTSHDPIPSFMMPFWPMNHNELPNRKCDVQHMLLYLLTKFHYFKFCCLKVLKRIQNFLMNIVLYIIINFWRK